MNKVSLIFVTVILLGCRHKSQEAAIIPIKLNGINGDALYFFDETNTAVTVIKPQYLNSINYDVKIERDTLILGDEFVGLINVYKPNFKILIDSPRKESIVGKGDNPNKEFRFTPLSYGTFKFNGTIEYDTAKLPFEYNFIVLKK